MKHSILTCRILGLTGLFLVAVTVLYAQNPKPFVIPELKEWSGKSGDFVPTPQTRIVCDDETLLPVAQNFADDFAKLFGMKPEVATGKAKNGDFRLTLKKDKKLGKEGYSIQIGKQVVVSAPEAVGVGHPHVAPDKRAERDARFAPRKNNGLAGLCRARLYDGLRPQIHPDGLPEGFCQGDVLL